MFAGDPARDAVLQHLNSLENVFNLESNARHFYDSFRWGIEAREIDGKIRKRVLSTPFKSYPLAPRQSITTEGFRLPQTVCNSYLFEMATKCISDMVMNQTSGNHHLYSAILGSRWLAFCK